MCEVTWSVSDPGNYIEAKTSGGPGGMSIHIEMRMTFDGEADGNKMLHFEHADHFKLTANPQGPSTWTQRAEWDLFSPTFIGQHVITVLESGNIWSQY